MNEMRLETSILLVYGTLNMGEEIMEMTYGSKTFTSTAIGALPGENKTTLSSA